MSSLYPLRHIPQFMVLMGSMLVIFSGVIAIAHWGFDVAVISRNTGKPLSEKAIGLLLAAFTGAGLLVASLGRAILRAAARHKLASRERQRAADHPIVGRSQASRHRP